MTLLDKYDLFIFDWDGTLVEIKLINKLNEKLNFLWKMRKQKSIAAALENKGVIRLRENVEKKAAQRHYRSVIDFLMLVARPDLQEHSLETLKFLRQHRKKLVLFSNGAYWRVSKEAKDLGAAKYFDFMLSAQNLPLVKPNPYGINLIMKREKATKARTLYIGDMLDDVLAARLAKVDCCAVSCGFDDYTALKQEKPKYLFKSIREFYGSLAKK